MLPEVVIEVAFTTGANLGTALHLDDPTRGLLDTGTLASGGGEGIWEDISGYGRQVNTHRGSTRIDSPIIRYETGTATVALTNEDRRFDPTHLGGPYVVAGRSQVTPMRALRVRAIWDGTTYDLFRGFADEWQVDWEGPSWSEATVPASDAFKVLSNRRRAAVAPVGAGEDSGARVTRVLDAIGWPSGDRMISTGDSTLQATTLEGDALSELQLVADSEIGELYVDGAGRVTFRNRNAVLTQARSNTPQAEFGDADPELRYAERGLSISADDSTLYNEIMITREGGAEQTAADTESQDEFLVRTFQSSGLLLETDQEAEDYAGFLLHVSSEPEVRFTQLIIKPLRDPDTLFPHALGREIGDRITIIRRPPGGGDPIEQDCFIRGIAHETTIQRDWVTTWTLQRADRFSFLTLAHTTLGRLDENALAY